MTRQPRLYRLALLAAKPVDAAGDIRHTQVWNERARVNGRARAAHKRYMTHKLKDHV